MYEWLGNVIELDLGKSISSDFIILSIRIKQSSDVADLKKGLRGRIIIDEITKQMIQIFTLLVM